jgi:hypothetical protein
VVGVTCEDLLSTIELLEEHAADKQMGPRHRSERQGSVGLVEDGAAEAIGPADRKGKLGHTPVAPGGNTIGESAARPRDPSFVESDEKGVRRQGAEDQLCFTRLQRRRGQPAPLFEFDYRQRRGDPASIKRLQFLQRPVGQPADDKEAETDRIYCRTASLSGKVSPHIFSRL